MNPLIKNTLSIVIPTFNEEGNIELLYSKLIETLTPLELDELEFIFVDDGSQDRSLEIVKKLSIDDPRVKYISFSRNFGHQPALKAGLDHAQFAGVVSLDADLQHPVKLIPEMIEKWKNGAEVVYTKRKDVSLPWFKRTTSKLFYRIINTLSQIKLEDGVADFRLLDQKVIHALRAYKESNLFIRGLIPALGFKQESIDYTPHKRFAGETKYSFSKMIRFALTGITSLSAKPLYFSIYFGVFFAMLAFIYGLYAIYIFAFGHEAIPGWTSIIASILLIGGIQLIMIGIIGIYLGKVFAQSKGRPNYIIAEKNTKND
ncbi:glycosyltransferase family 2 protein [Crocinitomicaceae bacterium]|jgi:glycosyltransferase involved in cell wall biosynthesis|nr:glycosyltransferase family 2 protein [Crocinitomicaceae bacterium]